MTESSHLWKGGSEQKCAINLSRASSVSLTTCLGLEVLLALGSLCRVLDERHIENITHSPLEALPHAKWSRRTPIQRTNPGLNIVLELQSTVLCTANLGPWGGDLVLGLLVGQLQDSGTGAFGVGLVICCGSVLAAGWLLAILLGVDVCVLVPGL